MVGYGRNVVFDFYSGRQIVHLGCVLDDALQWRFDIACTFSVMALMVPQAAFDAPPMLTRPLVSS